VDNGWKTTTICVGKFIEVLALRRLIRTSFIHHCDSSSQVSPPLGIQYWVSTLQLKFVETIRLWREREREREREGITSGGEGGPAEECQDLDQVWCCVGALPAFGVLILCV
jgi:hypothetical protein